MGILDTLIEAAKGAVKGGGQGIIDHGRNKNGGGHDHRTNTGQDRTPAQKKGDAERRKKD
jgi:hypothetical protein